MRIATGVLVLAAAANVCHAAPMAAVSGVVRDTQGVAQIGAMVQVLASGSLTVTTAFTDIYGRYRVTNLVPGRYQVRASASLFVPATRANLLLAMGTRATVNLTLSMLSDMPAWLPVERRKSNEPDDDWTWTLRSAANRPILRMTDDGQMVMVSSSVKEGSRRPPTETRASMMSGDGGFGGGGSHEVLTVDRVLDDGADLVLRTDIASARTPYGRGPSVEFDAGYQRRVGFAGESRLVVGYQSHPEMMQADGALGLQMMRLASAQRIKLGDMIDIEAGGTVYAVRTSGTAISSQPFVRVSVHPGTVWALQYRLATSRDVQSFDALDSVESPMPIAVIMDGRLRTESGQHQEFAVSRTLGPGRVQAAVYSDRIDRPLISGTGVLDAADRVAGHSLSGILADTVTDSFEFLGRGYATRGVSLAVSEPLTTALWAAVEYQNGAALSTQSLVPAALPDVAAALRAQPAEAITGVLKGRLLRSGTKLRASYRWQPRRLVTPVAGYEAFSDQPYLGVYVRQMVRWGDHLPPGLDATVAVTNLLAQGYQPFLSADGRTLFLAQSSRTIQAGVSFTF